VLELASESASISTFYTFDIHIHTSAYFFSSYTANTMQGCCSVENWLLVETNVCRIINSQTLVAALSNNIQQCKETSVTSLFYATSGDKLD